LDGDRGGDLILKALLQVAKVDYVAKAPRGKEVEDLGPKQILKILKERVPIDKIVKPKTKERRKKDIVMVSRPIMTTVSELRGTLEAVLLDEKLTQIERMPVSELCIKLQEIKGTHTIVFDGVITQRLLDIAEDKGIKCIIGERISGVVKRPVAIQILTMDKLVSDTNKQ
jgi:DNA primase